MPQRTRLRLAVFDCDGTLVDSLSGIVAAMEGAFRAHGHAVPSSDAVRRVVGLPLVDAIAALLPELERHGHAALSESYRESFRQVRGRAEHDEPLYPGAVAAIEALEAAADTVLGIATGKSRRGLTATMEKCGLGGRFVTMQTSDDGPGKPHPDMLHRAMTHVGTAPEDTVMIGDTTFDMLMARAAGTGAVGVAWGYHGVEELRAAGAHVVVDSFAEVPAVFDSLTRRD